MSRALHDDVRSVPTHGHPRDPRRAEIVKRHPLVELVGDVQVRAIESGRQHCRPEAPRHVLAIDRNYPAALVTFGVQRVKQGEQIRLDSEGPRAPGLRPLLLLSRAIEAAADIDDALL
nr:hypothetical protein [Polyangium spumosum]